MHGFTLIELLVVISIIALLVSILLPALGAAREAGMQASCLSNMSQLTKAVFMYQTDFTEHFPKQWYQEPGVPGGWTLFGEQISPYVGVVARVGAETANYPSGLLAAKVFRCPQQWPGATNTGREGMYGVNPNVMPYINRTAAGETTQANKFDARYPNVQMKDALVTDRGNNVMITDAKRPGEHSSNEFNARDWGNAVSPHFSPTALNYAAAFEWWADVPSGKGSRGFVDGHAEANGLQDMNGDWRIGDFPVGYQSWLSK